MCYRFTNIANTYRSNNALNLARNSVKFAFYTIIFAVFIFVINCGGQTFKIVYAEQNIDNIEQELGNSTQDILNDIDFGELEDMLTEIDSTFNLFNGWSFKDYVARIIKGEESVSIEDFINIFLSSIKESFKNIIFPLSVILIVVLLCLMFNNIKSGKISGVSEIIYFVCLTVVIIIVSSLCAGLIKDTKEGLSNIQEQMNVIFPILLSLMTAMGGVASVKAYTPMLAFLSNAISNIFVYVLLPLFSLSLILSIVGNLSDNTKLTKLNGFINSIFKWILGAVFAVFMSFLTFKGLTAGASDGISVKATKYAIKNYVPMLGGYISEGFELFKAGSLLVKNATGFTSIILLFSTIAVPIISIGVVELGLKLLAGIIEPIGDNRSSNLLYAIAKSLKLLIVVLIGVAMMYFLTIFLLTCSVSNVL